MMLSPGPGPRLHWWEAPLTNITLAMTNNYCSLHYGINLIVLLLYLFK